MNGYPGQFLVVGHGPDADVSLVITAAAKAKRGMRRVLVRPELFAPGRDLLRDSSVLSQATQEPHRPP